MRCSRISNLSRFHMAAYLTIACGLGCTPSPADISGRVTLDGVPLPRGVVHFFKESDANSPVGTAAVGDDGFYSVQIAELPKSGANKFVVSISARGRATRHPQGGPPTPGELLTPEHYSDPAKSGLEAEVRPGRNVIDIVLESSVNDDNSNAAVPEQPAGDKAGPQATGLERGESEHAADADADPTDAAQSSADQ